MGTLIRGYMENIKDIIEKVLKDIPAELHDADAYRITTSIAGIATSLDDFEHRMDTYAVDTSERTKVMLAIIKAQVIRSVENIIDRSKEVKPKPKPKSSYPKRVLRYLIVEQFECMEEAEDWVLLFITLMIIGVLPFLFLLITLKLPLVLAILLGFVITPPVVIYHSMPTLKAVGRAYDRCIKWLKED